MGQKVNPVGIRLGITRDWTSRWYANKRTFPIYILQDWQVRDFLKKKLSEASVSRIHIERAARKANITIHTARPGVGIGKKGAQRLVLGGARSGKSDVAESLAIERRGRTVTIASSRAAQITFEADGREHTEQSRNGRSMRTRAGTAGLAAAPYRESPRAAARRMRPD